MTDERELRALIALAKKMPHGESSRRDAVSFASFETRLAQRGQRTRRRIVWAASTLVTCGALAFVWPTVFGPSLPGREAPLSYRVRAPSARAPVDGQQVGEELAFSDGSHVRLEQRSEARVAQLTQHGARVELRKGRAEVSIAKRKHAAWQLVAGPYTVRVTGTAFRLAWSAEREELEVAMRHGSVVVTGPLAEHGVELAAGQRMVGSPRTRRLLVEAWSGKSDSALAAAAEAASRPAKEPSVKVLRSRERPRGMNQHGWAKRVAQGEFDSVLQEARALGHARVLDASSASDLAALADAARYARQDALGQRALLALRERFADAEVARDSAFLLGRLSRNRTALSWYERYLREQPNGAYVSQALGRSMMLCYELGDVQRAKELAQTYLSRFPSGPYAGSARKLDTSLRAKPATP